MAAESRLGAVSRAFSAKRDRVNACRAEGQLPSGRDETSIWSEKTSASPLVQFLGSFDKQINNRLRKVAYGRPPEVESSWYVASVVVLLLLR